MPVPRNFSSKRNRARRWIAERGLTLTELAVGRFHITGPGVDLHIAELALLHPAELIGARKKAAQ